MVANLTVRKLLKVTGLGGSGSNKGDMSVVRCSWQHLVVLIGTFFVLSLDQESLEVSPCFQTSG